MLVIIGEDGAMWQLSTLDIFVALTMAFVVGFAVGMAWWEFIRPERAYYAGDSDNASDLSVHPGTGSVASDMGPRRDRHPHPADGRQDHLDNRGAGRVAVSR